MKTIEFYNIEWDEESGDDNLLPSTHIATVNDGFDVNADGADLLSNQYEFCVLGFCWREQRIKEK